jgi:hypothetical protein
MTDKNLEIIKYIGCQTIILSTLWSNLVILPSNDNFYECIFNSKRHSIKNYHVKFFSLFLTLGVVFDIIHKK